MRNADAGTEEPCDTGRCQHACEGPAEAQLMIQISRTFQLHRLDVSRLIALLTSDA